MKLNGKQYDKFILNGKTYDKFYLNNKIYQSLDPGLILDLPLQNNFTDYSASGISMVAGGTSNQPTFALSGRKAGEYCAVFNGSQSIKTTTNLPINSDKVTIAFWIKTTHTSRETLVNGSNVEVSINAWAGLLGFYTHGNVGGNAVTTPRNFTNWTRIIIVLDRTLGSNQSKIYVNGILKFNQRTDNAANNIGNLPNSVYYFGQSAALTQGFVGSLMHLEILNYPITASEALADYNSFL